MNWQNFRHHGESSETAFEAFVTLLFEGWCRRIHPDKVRDIRALDGRGGDGGVEAFAVLQDGTEIGLQAKWFQGKFDHSRAEKVLKSFRQACTRHPKLVRYIVCLPGDLKDSKKAAQGQKSERDHWDELIATAKKEQPGVSVEYWGDNELTRMLAEHDDGSMRGYWFDEHAVKPADLAAKCRAIIKANFAGRYLPDLHQHGRLDGVLALLLGDIDARAVQLGRLERMQSAITRALEEVQRLIRLPDEEVQDATLQKTAAECIASLQKTLALSNWLNLT